MISSDTWYGVLVGCIPSFAMMVASIVLMNYKISETLEAGFQNFAAGLILAAVAQELFPLLSDIPGADGGIGLAIGFALGLLVIYGLDKVMGDLEEVSDSESSNRNEVKKQNSWELLPVDTATEAINDIHHKSHILSHLREMTENLNHISIQSDEIIGSSLSVFEEMKIAEEIDEAIHSLHYKLDHSRRLLQGAESEHAATLAQNSRWPPEKKIEVHAKILDLKKCIAHLIEHLETEEIGVDTMDEIHGHMDEAAALIEEFHLALEQGPSKWLGSKVTPVRIVQGSTLPISLIVPVNVDAFADGFLIGVAYALSPKAGVILAAANTLEMASVGITLAASVSKCLGSTRRARTVAIISPPLVMLLATVIGLAAGAAAESINILYAAFVSFGIVSLLALVVKELLIEARKAQGESEIWYISIMTFVGVFVVLIMSRFTPDN